MGSSTRAAAKGTGEESSRQRARSSLIQAAKDGSLEKSLQDFKEKAAMPEVRSASRSTLTYPVGASTVEPARLSVFFSW